MDEDTAKLGKTDITSNEIETLLQTIDQIPLPVNIYTIDGTLTYLNKASIISLGLRSAEEMKGRFNIFNTPVIGNMDLGKYFRKAALGEIVHINDFRIVPNEIPDKPHDLKMGPQFFDVTIFPITQPDNRVTHIVSISSDITHRKQNEDEMIREQKLDSLGLLAGGIAHDFNNMLTSIFGYIDLARLRLEPADLPAKYLDSALASFQKAKDLTYQLLTFARGNEPVKRTLNLESVIKSAVNLSLSGSNLRCKWELQEGLYPAEIDENQMSQVFSNLVINACQAMPDGGTITICAENIELTGNNVNGLDAGRYIRISFHDQGPGIPEAYIQKIFDPFYTTKHNRAGLGLSICHSIIRKHHGKISVSSAHGGGSVFTILIPASDRMYMLETDCSMSNKPLHHGTILLMDDQEEIRKSTGATLRMLGYTVILANDGREAVTLYRENMEQDKKIDALILDMTVPAGVGGMIAGQEIRKLDPDALIIVSSGYAVDPVMAEPWKHGFDGFLAKPYMISELMDILETTRKNRKK